MPELFEPWTINGLQLTNRFVRSATMDNMGRDGQVTEAQVELYRELAHGEIGLIISHGIFPSREGQAGGGQLGAHSDEMIPSLKKLTDIVHRNGGKIAAQILHAGWFAGSDQPGSQPVGPSPVINPFNGLPVRGLSSQEVYELAERFVQAGRRLIEAGFDGIQLHGAHSWLLSCFFSPVTNRREDEWGGTPEKRLNLVRHIYQGIRRSAGPDYPIFIKFGLKEYHPQGKSLAEGIRMAQMLEGMGMDAIEVSEGLEEDRGHHIRLDAVSPYYLEECRACRQSVKLPLILVGGMRKLQDMEQVVRDNLADAVSMCRPFIMDPYIVKKFHEGAAGGSGCNSCNGCRGIGRRVRLQCALTADHTA
jgi:2,4-dienoyl-CoA reductase-like NADH-dependent reductase (Old Yellow Enzyme family)